MTDKILKLTKKIMVLQSTKDNRVACNRALDIAREELKDFYVENFEKDGIKSILAHNAKPGTKKFKIILNAHLDVVPAEKNQFMPVEKNGKLYGRGAYDMKAATAVMIHLFKKLAKSLSYPIGLQIVTDEETSGLYGTMHQLNQGIRADFVISGDCGSNLDIITEAKGIIWLKLHTQGTKTHGAYLWRGKNALWKLHTALAVLHKLFPVPDSEQWVTTMNLAKIETENTAFNRVPDGATAYLDIRFIPEDEKDLMKRITKAVSPDVEIETMFCNQPEYVAPDNPYVKLLQKSARQVTNRQIKLLKSHAPSDIRHYKSVNIDGVAFGAKGAHQHGENEWVDIKSLKEYYDILKQFLCEIK